MRKFLSYLAKFAGIAVFMVLVYRIGVFKILAAMGAVRIGSFLLTVLALASVFFIKALRWRIICRAYGIGITVPYTVRSFFIGTFIGFLTPGRLGELFRAYHLKAAGHELPRSVSSVIVDRMYDLLLLLLFSSASIIYFQAAYGVVSFELNYRYIVLAILGSIAVCTVLVLLVARSPLKAKLGRLFRSFLTFRTGVAQQCGILALSLLSVCVGYLTFYWFALSIGIQGSLIDIVACAMIINLIQLLPVSILGIGTRDITLVYLFGFLGIASDKAVALSMAYLLTHLAAVIPGLVLFLADGSGLRTSVKEAARKNDVE